MPEVKIAIGNREFEVACQSGEEHYLQSAARLLDVEATSVLSQMGRMPDTRMLLMAGLMLADKTAGLEDQLRGMEAQVKQMHAELDALQKAPKPAPERVEVPVIPANVIESMAELAARAEAIAAAVDDKQAG
ncbi:cell division protein ZapA [Mesobaculum littorinae]|uniref:Cell division protein ZapA n=1 Tax=Mesobaculum littorinae TaxID=2486419 RepID=A0A438AKY1_9RHOB|nr:cell division protein ZapA [Mesobaculum littorinae]RVV99483.1 cell division protein ZapA [Mesobaculum littorinae]